MQNGQQLFIWGGAGVNLPGTRQLEKWYRLEIEAIGNNISFYVDGDLVYERKDNSNPSGGAILWSFDAVAEYDNVVITGNGIPDSGPSGYAVEPEGKLATSWGAIKR